MVELCEYVGFQGRVRRGQWAVRQWAVRQWDGGRSDPGQGDVLGV